MFLLVVNGEIALRLRFRGNPDGGSHGHQSAIPFHHVDVLLRERNLYAHSRWVVRTMRRDAITPGGNAGHAAAACQEQRCGGAEAEQRAAEKLHTHWKSASS